MTYKNIHPTPMEVAEETLRDDSLLEKDKKWAREYKFYIENGYNRNVNYALYEKAWAILKRIMKGFVDIREFAEKTPIQNHLWYILAQKSTQSGCLTDERLETLIEYMENFERKSEG